MDHLGDPDFSFRGFSLWIHGWERDAVDFWDNNWLDITARFKSGGAMGSAVIVVAGTILHSTDLEYAAKTFAKLNDSLQGSAEFATLDPGFHLKLEARSTGAIGFTVEMFPGPDETYEYSTELDQTYLAPAVPALNTVVKAYGPRGERPPMTR